MTVAAALVLLGAALLVWPVPSASQRRLTRLHRATRIAAGARPSVVPPRVRVDRSRAVAGSAVVLAALVGAVAGGGTSGGVPLGIAAGAGAGAAAVVVLSVRAARHDALRRRELLTALAVMRGELDAGAGFPAALSAARERAGSAIEAFDLSPVADAPARVDTVAHARRCLSAGAGLVAATGSPWAAVAAGIGRDVAGHDARDREVAAALAGARASTVVLAGLPVLGLGLATTLGADPAGFLLSTPAGRWVLAAGAALDLLGVVSSTLVAGRAAR